MKRTLPTRGIAFASFVLLYSLLFSTAFAQNAQSKNEVKVTWKKSENGDVQKVEKAVPVTGNANISEIISEYKIMDELGDLAPGEEVEIIIRRKKGPDVVKDLNIIIDDNSKSQGNLFEFDSNDNHFFHEKAQRPLLGVEFDQVSEEIATKLGYKGTKGSRVTKVLENTAAEKAGLQEGDILTKIDGKTINEWLDLRTLIGEHAAGDEISVSYFRGGKSYAKDIVLGENNMNWRNQENNLFDMHHMPKGNTFLWKDEQKSCEKAPIDPNKAFLGVYLNLNGESSGVGVTGIIEGTTAEKMKLQENDIITEINGNKVGNYDALVGELNKLKAGDKTKVTFLRDGKEMSSSAKMGSKADMDDSILNVEKRVIIKDCDKPCDGSGASIFEFDGSAEGLHKIEKNGDAYSFFFSDDNEGKKRDL